LLFSLDAAKNYLDYQQPCEIASKTRFFIYAEGPDMKEFFCLLKKTDVFTLAVIRDIFHSNTDDN